MGLNKPRSPNPHRNTLQVATTQVCAAQHYAIHQHELALQSRVPQTDTHDNVPGESGSLASGRGLRTPALPTAMGP